MGKNHHCRDCGARVKKVVKRDPMMGDYEVFQCVKNKEHVRAWEYAGKI